MPTILYVSYSGVYGGSERVLLDCAAGLGGEPVLACPPGPLAAQAETAGLHVLTLPVRALDLRAGLPARLRAGAGLIAHAAELRRLTADLAPALTVAWGMRSALAALGLPRSCPLAVAHQDFLPGALIARGVRAATARAAAVCVPSEAVAADLDPGGALAGRIHVIAPGVDPAAFAQIGPPADGPPVVLVLGALAPWKRPDLALEAVARARRALPGLRVCFVGAPVTGATDPGPELHARASAPDLAGAVTFAGPAADPRGALAACTALLHCTPREPFGIVLLEAGAAGRPVIAPAAAGPAEIVDGGGVLYRAGDASAAAQALIEVLSDPARARTLGAAGRERVRERFTRERTRAEFRAALGPLAAAGEAGRAGAAGAAGETGRASAPRAAGEAGRAAALSIVTVTHNSGPQLAALLDSIQRHLPEAEIIAVDCASADDSVAVARARPGVISVPLSENLGFGRASNRGLEHVSAPVTVFVNPDVVLIDGSLRALAAEAGRAQRLLAPALLDARGRRQDSAHPAPGSPADLIAAVVPPVLLPGRLGAALAPWRSQSPRPVGWAIGAALAGPTDALRALGPFAEDIFMYGEDLELGLRAAAAGLPTWFWPQARVLHAGAHSTAVAFGGEDVARLAAARHAGIARARGPRAARRDDVVQGLTFASRIAVKALLGRDTARERRQLAAVRAGRRV
ncbi:MAG TPA: glycosyltransferase [Solirubrobacteraceae bacterium]|nr:glycosyltransferase [Solirubrobacteraceae bacterium]